MTTAPSPEEIYERGKQEGGRRLFMPPMEQVATGFIAGVTVVFGVVALGIVTALIEPELGRGVAKVAGALAFGIGLVFLIVGRSELFSENFFDPVISAIDIGDRNAWLRLLRLWVSILALNLVGGAVLLGVLTVPGALPEESNRVLVRVAEEIVAKEWTATLARAVLAGALITLLSYMLKALTSVTARILVAYMVGFFLAVGPFDHGRLRAARLVRCLGVRCRRVRGRGEQRRAGSRGKPSRRHPAHHVDPRRPGEGSQHRLKRGPSFTRRRLGIRTLIAHS